MGTYTPNYNLYMPSIGEQGWGELVSNNFEILDTNLNDLQNHIDTIDTQIDTINTNIGDGTRILSISSSSIINSENFENYASYDDNNVYTALFSNTVIFESIPKPQHSCKLMIISVNGNLTINGNIDTYPTTLQSELPPNSPETNTYNIDTLMFTHFQPITLTYTANGNNSQISILHDDYLNIINNTIPMISEPKSYQLSIPAATAAGGYGGSGTAGTAENTCNGGGGGTSYAMGNPATGGTGCIFGQYAGASISNNNSYGYGSGASSKYRCALIFVVNGNLTINESCTITQIGGNSGYTYDGNFNRYYGGYGGGSRYGGGGGAPVFIYYTGTYTNNGTINVNGGRPSRHSSTAGSNGGAGGIKTTKITI